MFSTKFDEKTKLWYGRNAPSLYNPKISVAQVILDKLNIYGPKIAQISDNNGIETSFAEIRTKTIRAAQNLQKRGYEPKQVFGIMAKNSYHLAPIVFASMSIACPVNSIDPSFGKIEMKHMINVVKPVLMFYDVGSYDLLKECLTELGNDAKIFTFGGKKGEAEPVENLFLETNNEKDFLPVEVDGENDAVVIVCSSGTTALSKGDEEFHVIFPFMLATETHFNFPIEQHAILDQWFDDFMQMKVIDDQGRRCGPNVDGEICVKTNYRFLGYYGNRKATEELFDDEGFTMTGDIGKIDEDGYLYIVDRKKDLLKYCNFQILPSEIEDYLIESNEIKSACVVGIPDEVMSDLPTAVIVRANGSNITEKEVFDLVAGHFSDCCKLRGGVYFVDSLPTTPSGKFLRRKVKEMATELFCAKNI